MPRAEAGSTTTRLGALVTKTATTKMKTCYAVLILAAAGAVLADKYTTKYDNVDLDEILNSSRLLTFYVDCLLGKTTRCSPDAKELKANLPDALLLDCSKCSEKQKAGAEKVINFLMEKKPELWKQLEAKYDPEGTYAAKYKDRLPKTTSQ